MRSTVNHEGDVRWRWEVVSFATKEVNCARYQTITAPAKYKRLAPSRLLDDLYLQVEKTEGMSARHLDRRGRRIVKQLYRPVMTSERCLQDVDCLF